MNTKKALIDLTQLENAIQFIFENHDVVGLTGKKTYDNQLILLRSSILKMVDDIIKYDLTSISFFGISVIAHDIEKDKIHVDFLVDPSLGSKSTLVYYTGNNTFEYDTTLDLEED